jgi:hypothetical protein
MAFQLYLRVQPRSLYLVSDSHALLFQQPDVHGNVDVSSTRSRKDGPSAIVELIPADALDLGQLVKINKGRSIGGVLGLLSLPIGPYRLRCCSKRSELMAPVSTCVQSQQVLQRLFSSFWPLRLPLHLSFLTPTLHRQKSFPSSSTASARPHGTIHSSSREAQYSLPTR